jgi:alkylation response protein AidB-like acyl-CoA dehydrogenase
MDFKFTPEEEKFRQEVRAFLKQELPPEWERQCLGEVVPITDQEWEVARTMARKLGARGWLSLNWPREYGGQAASHITQLILNEELAYHRALGRDVFGVGMLAPTLIRLGSEEQKKQYLPPIARGEVFWCEGYTEPDAGSDLAGVRLQARETEDCFVVNGQKVYTTTAHRADWIFFLARVDPQSERHRGLGFFLADMKTPGITVSPLIDLPGVHSFNEVFFDEARVPKENLVGEKGKGWYVAMTLLDFERSGVEFSARGRRNLEELVQYAREKGDVPVHLRHRLAEMAIEVEISRWMSYRIAWMEDRGIVPNYEASMVKVFGSELLQRLAHIGTQLLGLYSQLEDDPKWAPLRGRVRHWYLSSVAETIAAGTSEIQRNIIATRGLGLPRG